MEWLLNERFHAFHKVNYEAAKNNIYYNFLSSKIVQLDFLMKLIC